LRFFVPFVSFCGSSMVHERGLSCLCLHRRQRRKQSPAAGSGERRSVLRFFVPFVSFCGSSGFPSGLNVLVGRGFVFGFEPGGRMPAATRKASPVISQARVLNRVSKVRSAGFQPAVSPTSSRQSGRTRPASGGLETRDKADWKSALRLAVFVSM